MLPIWLLQQGLGQHLAPPYSHVPSAMYPPPAAPVQLADPPMLSAAANLTSCGPHAGLGQSALHPLIAAACSTPFPVAAAAAAAASAEAVVSLNTRLALSHPAVFPLVTTAVAEPSFLPGSAAAVALRGPCGALSHPAAFPALLTAPTQPSALPPATAAAKAPPVLPASAATAACAGCHAHDGLSHPASCASPEPELQSLQMHRPTAAVKTAGAATALPSVLARPALAADSPALPEARLPPTSALEV